MSVPWIVVFDPEKDDREAARRALVSAGYDTSVVADLASLAELLAEQPDLLICALPSQHPKALQRLKGLVEATPIPVIVLAAEIPTWAASLISGFCDEVLLKQMSTGRILHAVHRCLERTSKQWQSSGSFRPLVRESFEDERSEAARRFKVLSLHSDDLFCEVDIHGRFHFISENTSNHLRLDAKALLGHPAWEVASPRHQEMFATAVQDALSKVQNRQVQIQMDDTSGRWFEAKIAPFGGDSGEMHALVSFRDVTSRVTAEVEQRTLTDQLRSVQRRETVGRLAGGVAHDFNNFLTAIITYAQLIQASVSDLPMVAADVQEILDAGTQAARLTRQLQLFKRREFAKLGVFDLNRLVIEMRKLVLRTIPEDVSTDIVVDDDPLWVRADLVLLQQSLLALVLNARDAVSAGCSITIEAGICADDPNSCYLAVVDDGASTQFERMSSERESESAGFQLGLHVAREIARELGGTLILQQNTVRGCGRRAEMRLPLVPAATETPAVAVQNTHHGGQSVLVVEDQELVLNVVKRTLVRAGYQVFAASNSREALVHLEAQDVDVLLTDIVLPGTSGPTIAQKVRARSPRTRVVYMTGYPDDELIQRGAQDNTPILEKPFTPAELFDALRHAVH